MALVELTHIYKTFSKGNPDEVHAIKDISLKISYGEMFFIIGTNGSGKTTLINLVHSTFKPDSGEIKINNQNIIKLSRRKNADLFGRLYQNPKENIIPSYTVKENILLAAKKNKKVSIIRNLSTKKKEGLISEYLKNFAPDLLELQNSLAGKLSGGQMQLLGLVIMLISKPKILLLDEFTSSLDVKNANQMLLMVRNYVRENETSAIIVSHNISQTFEFGTKIVLLHRGKLIDSFDPLINPKEEVIEMFYKLDREELNYA